MMNFDFENSLNAPNSEPKAKTVTEISNEIKRFVEGNFNHVLVRGEIFGAKRADSGHWYLSLKDENAVLSAVCWRGVAGNLKVKIEDGLEVIATGKITTFAGKSSYQLVIESLEPAGQGALLKLLEERKQQFIKEGLFDAADTVSARNYRCGIQCFRRGNKRHYSPYQRQIPFAHRFMADTGAG